MRVFAQRYWATRPPKTTAVTSPATEGNDSLVNNTDAIIRAIDINLELLKVRMLLRVAIFSLVMIMVNSGSSALITAGGPQLIWLKITNCTLKISPSF